MLFANENQDSFNLYNIRSKNRAIEFYSFLIGKSFQFSQDENGEELILENEYYRIVFTHDQDCCESVFIEDVIGELSDLNDSPLLMAECVKSHDASGYESQTHTWYKFATINGYVTIRFWGGSNGYYSESVDVYVTDKSTGQIESIGASPYGTLAHDAEKTFELIVREIRQGS